MITRRQFMKATAATAAVASVGGFLTPRRAHAFVQSPGIPLFNTTLRGVGPGGIPVALPDPKPAPVTGVLHYSIQIKQFEDQIVPMGSISKTGDRTTFWGYVPTIGLGGNIKPTHLGGIIVGKGRNPNDSTDKNVPIQITFKNLITASQHILPVDITIPGAAQAVNRTATHLHGGLVPWISDGGPFDWFNFKGVHGDSFLNNQVLNPVAAPNQAEYYYPLNQSARFMWYHDHAVGITRLNAYAGIASAMLIRDSFEKGLIDGSGGVAQGLPKYIEAGGNEIPLVFQDKIFVGPNTTTNDPGWSSMVQAAATKPGSLWYAHTYDQTRWELVSGPSGSPPDPSSIPEFFGDTMLVNGTTFPEVTVQARRYRLRMLNACNARFLNLQLYLADPSSLNGITLDLTGSPDPFLADGTTPNPAFNPNYGTPTNDPFLNHAAEDTANWLQIGTEGGFLSKPTRIPSNKSLIFTGGPLADQQSLVVAPAERPDLIVDFSSVTPGTKVVLYNDAPAPFPFGDPLNDYFPGLNPGANPTNTNHDGFGPNTRVLMRFNVVPAKGDSDLTLTIGTGTDLTGGIDPSLIPWSQITLPMGVPTRFLSLNEYHDEFGRLIQILGNAAAPLGSPYFNSALYADYPGQSTPTAVGSTEEHVNEGAKEVWEIFNTTGDVHPMHFHLVNVQVINRQPFSDFTTFTDEPVGPFPNELGWKETVPMYPGTVTRVIMKFDLAPIVDAGGNPITTTAKSQTGQLAITNGQPPESPRTGGFEYVWHCHILEHEEHDMMHALVVTPQP